MPNSIRDELVGRTAERFRHDIERLARVRDADVRRRAARAMRALAAAEAALLAQARRTPT